jgi:hypothetical protein
VAGRLSSGTVDASGQLAIERGDDASKHRVQRQALQIASAPRAGWALYLLQPAAAPGGDADASSQIGRANLQWRSTGSEPRALANPHFGYD